MEVEEVDEDQMILTQIIKQKTLEKPKRRLVKTTAMKGRNLKTAEVMLVNQTLEVVDYILAGRKRGVDSTLEDIIEDVNHPSSDTKEEEPVSKRKLIKRGPIFT